MASTNRPATAAARACSIKVDACPGAADCAEHTREAAATPRHTITINSVARKVRDFSNPANIRGL